MGTDILKMKETILNATIAQQKSFGNRIIEIERTIVEVVAQIDRMKENITFLHQEKKECLSNITILQQAEIALTKELDRMKQIDQVQSAVSIPKEHRLVTIETKKIKEKVVSRKNCVGPRIRIGPYNISVSIINLISSTIKGKEITIKDLRQLVHDSHSNLSKGTIKNYVVYILNDLEKTYPDKFIRDGRKVTIKTLKPTTQEEIDEWVKQERERELQLRKR